ncbi:MAG: ABC transporter substrate-binding protein [Gaiellaceae bacterium]
MRKILILLALSAVAIVAASLSGRESTAAAAPVKCAGAGGELNLVRAGKLTVGTDNPAFPPWFGGGEKTKPWKLNDPNSGKGFESAVTYAIAEYLGFQRTDVIWTYTPFNRSFAPGRKAFDFDINQISYTPARARVVSFSNSYYDVNQAIVALRGRPIASVRSINGLRRYKLGAQLGTTSYQFIARSIRPSQSPAVYDTNDAAVAALKSRQIDGLVVDLPTAFYVSAVQVPNGKIVGQFAAPPGGEHFGMVFQKGNPLVRCVNQALARIKLTGQLKRIQQTWLARVTGAPVLR